jgi:hypothetical protein
LVEERGDELDVVRQDGDVLRRGVDATDSLWSW